MYIYIYICVFGLCGCFSLISIPPKSHANGCKKKRENTINFVGPLWRSIDAFIRTLMDEEAYHGEGGMGLQVTCRHGEPQ